MYIYVLLLFFSFYGVNFCFGESTFATQGPLTWLQWTDELQCVQVTNMSLEFVEDASLKLRAARIIMARYNSRPMFKLGSIASNIENLFARMLNLYKEVSNLTTVRNKMSELEISNWNQSHELALENTINALGIAQSHYHRIRLEKKFFYKALKENAKKDEINRKRFLKKFGALPPGFHEPAELKGGMYTEYRRKLNNSSSVKDADFEPALQQEPDIYQRRQEGKSKKPIWKPGQFSDKLQYGGNWKPNENQQGMRRSFGAESHQPAKNQQDSQRSFDVAWQPNKKQDSQHSLDVAWQPNKKQDSQRSLDVAWQPKKKQDSQRSFDVAWQPNNKHDSQRSFEATWQPNKKQDSQRSYDTLWQPNKKQAMQRSYEAVWKKQQGSRRSVNAAWNPNQKQDSQHSYDAGWQPNKNQDLQLLPNDGRNQKNHGSQNVGGIEISSANRRAFQESYKLSGILDQRRGAKPFPFKNGIRSKKRVLWKPKTKYN